MHAANLAVHLNTIANENQKGDSVCNIKCWIQTRNILPAGTGILSLSESIVQTVYWCLPYREWPDNIIG